MNKIMTYKTNIIKKSNNNQDVWETLFLFLALLILFSSICYYPILKLNPSSIYVGSLMLCPSLAAIITLNIRGRSIKELPWTLENWKYIRLSYLTPIFYISIAYVLIWTLGFGHTPKESTILDWSKDLGVAQKNTPLVIVIMFLLLATVGVVKNIGSTLGEEVGWRGFFIFELKKILPFEGVSIVSGLIWSAWHWPIIIYYGGGNTIFQIISFTIMILGMSVILTYYTFTSKSLWPAAIFHSVHNIYIQKIFTPLTITTDKTSFWIDEYGLMLPIVTTLFAVFFWRKAKKEML